MKIANQQCVACSGSPHDDKLAQVKRLILPLFYAYIPVVSYYVLLFSSKVKSETTAKMQLPHGYLGNSPTP